MDVSGDDALARAGLTQNQDRRQRPARGRSEFLRPIDDGHRRQAFGQGEGLLPRRALAERASVRASDLLEPFIEPQAAALIAQLQQPVHDQDQFLQSYRLLQVVVGPELHRAHRVIDGPEGGDHDHAARKPLRPDPLDKIDPGFRTEVHVGHDHVVGPGSEETVRLGDGPGLIHRVPLLLQGSRHGEAQILVVLDEQNTGHNPRL